MKIETRAVSMTATNKPLILEGYAVVFDRPAQVGDFEEIILREALSETDISDVALFYNHDINRVPLARTPNTLRLEIDPHGLKFVAELPATEEGKAIYESVKRGDLRGCSFAFTVEKDIWVKNRRIIRQISKIYECSIVPYPAYSDTTVEARNSKGVLKMKFENVAQAFNFYNQKTIAQIERRAAEIETELSADGADVKSLNIELEGMKAAKENIEEAQGLLNNAKTTLLNLIETADTESVTQSAPLDEEKVLSSEEYRTAFYKTLQGKKLNSVETRAMKIARAKFEKRAGEFNTSTNSAAIIPTETLNEIISKARTQGGLLAECRMFSVPSNVAIPVATPKSAAQWHVEGAEVDTEKIDLTDSVTFSGNEIIKIFSISLKVQAMAISAFEAYLTDELTNCVMSTIETALVSGTGNGQGTGIMSVFDTDNTITLTHSPSYNSLVSLIAQLERGYSNGAKFALNNRTLWQYIYAMQDGNQRPIFVQDLQNEGIGKILGFPVVVDDNLDDNVILFGNFNYMAYNLPSGIVVETSRESSFKRGLIDYRAIAIADTKPLLKDAFVKMTFTA